MASFLAVLQATVLDTSRELRLAIVIGIKKTYHRRRRHRALARLTPVNYETVT